MSRTPLVPWMLRIAFAMCFIGHGAFGLLQKRDWLAFFVPFGVPEDVALLLMPVIGSVDIAIGIAGLFGPPRIVFLYGAFWCLMTAALRPLVGMSAGEFFERAGNFGIPIALLVATAGLPWLARIRTAQIDPRRMAQVRAICIATTALLLAGHGWLALESTPLLARHAALAGFAPAAVPLVGLAEILLAIACVLRPHPALMAGIAVWKIATESLFVVGGAPLWEVIERGGSYAAPLIVVALARERIVTAIRPARWSRAATAGLIAIIAAPAWAQSPGSLTSQLVTELQAGGFVVACRHAITDRTRLDRSPVNFDDPSTQRVLSPDGEQQAIDLGRSLAALKIRFGAVLASPFQRTRQSAASMAGRVEIAEALSAMARGKDVELRQLMSGPVDPGTNRLVVTHQGLIYRVFRTLKQGSVREGDCVIVRPNDQGGEVAALVSPAEWERAAKSR
jgi:phosphohistidine phosphatase SixA